MEEKDLEAARERPNTEVASSENERECENLRRNLSKVMDERDQLKLMLEDIRCQFTAETRLREYLEKMRNTLVKVLSNGKEDTHVRIEEALKILSSFNAPCDGTLQTTGDFLTDLSYSEQETVYGCVPTSAQRKQALRCWEAPSKALKTATPHPNLRKVHLTPGPSRLPQAIPRRRVQLANGDVQTEDDKNSLCFPNFDLDRTYGLMPLEDSINVEYKGSSSKVPSQQHSTPASMRSKTHQLTTDKPKPANCEGITSDPVVSVDPQHPVTTRSTPRKHNFVLWLGKRPEVCSCCRTRVFPTEFVRKCTHGCGSMVHARKCENEGPCSGGLT